MALDEKTWQLFGTLEEGPIVDDKPTMIARMLGLKLGMCSGWVHYGGHCVAFPHFVPDDAFLKMFPKAEPLFHDTARTGFMLVVDYYVGLLGVATMPTDDSVAGMLWHTTISTTIMQGVNDEGGGPITNV